MLIGEVARATGVTAKTLRYYEAEGLLHEPDRTPGGYRDYSADVVARVAFIRHAQATGLTLRQIHAVLTIRDDGYAPCVHVAELVADRLADAERRLRELRETRAQLRKLQQRLVDLDPAQCRPTSICSAIQPQAHDGTDSPVMGDRSTDERPHGPHRRWPPVHRDGSPSPRQPATWRGQR